MEIDNFVLDLKERGIEMVAIDYGEKNILVDLDNLKKEIEKIGVSEIADTYCEDMSFIANNGEFVEIHAVY